MKKRILLVLVLLVVVFAVGAAVKSRMVEHLEGSLTMTVDGNTYTYTAKWITCTPTGPDDIPSHYWVVFEDNGSAIYDMDMNFPYGLDGTYTGEIAGARLGLSAMKDSIMYVSRPLSGVSLDENWMRVTNTTDKRGNLTIRCRFDVTMISHEKNSKTKTFKIEDGELRLYIPAGSWD